MSIQIYKIKCLINNKSYVGQTSTNHRIQDHFRCASNGCHDCGGTSKLHSAIRKYGEENFEYEILEFVERGEADEIEDSYILQESTLAPFGYNSTLNDRPFQLFENRWASRANAPKEYEGIIDFIHVAKHRRSWVTEDKELEGFQIIKPDAATTHNQRLENSPTWAFDDAKIKELVVRCFPGGKRRNLAGRMVLAIYLYYRVGETAETIGERLNMPKTAVDQLIRRANRTANRPVKTRGRPKKMPWGYAGLVGQAATTAI